MKITREVNVLFLASFKTQRCNEKKHFHLDYTSFSDWPSTVCEANSLVLEPSLNTMQIGLSGKRCFIIDNCLSVTHNSTTNLPFFLSIFESFFYILPFITAKQNSSCPVLINSDRSIRSQRTKCYISSQEAFGSARWCAHKKNCKHWFHCWIYVCLWTAWNINLQRPIQTILSFSFHQEIAETLNCGNKSRFPSGCVSEGERYCVERALMEAQLRALFTLTVLSGQRKHKCVHSLFPYNTKHTLFFCS